MLKWLTGRARHQTSPADGPDNRRPHPPARLLSRLPARVPAGCRVYAIGDIHGRRDLLNQLHQAITADAATAPARRILIHLGDLVDRGPDSRGVIDSLLRPLAGFETVNLKGNHEDLLLRFLDDPAMGAMWLANGGRETLLSYGVTASGTEDAAGLLRCQLAFRERLSTPHLSFLRQLAISHSEGDYHFVHAGVRPGVPLDAQSDDDALWIRQAFLSSDVDFGRIVVHGHSVTPTPDVHHNRIGIDTGAYATGTLTALVLEGAERRFLATGDMRS